VRPFPLKNNFDPAVAGARADYKLALVMGGSFPVLDEFTGKAVAWSRARNKSVVSMKSTGSGNRSSLTISVETNEGTLLYDDLLVQPSVSSDPPLLRMIRVKCHRTRY